MRSKSILLVDDSAFDRGLFARVLEQRRGFKILEAATGEECLRILETEKVDLILMDIMMPGDLGTQVLLRLRESYSAIELPVIMVTVKGETQDVVGSLKNGANDYITKPVNFEIALSRIQTHLDLADSSREIARLREIAALDAMITTYNHEINNPLSVAIGCASGKSLEEDDFAVEKLRRALWRIADIVKNIGELTKQKELEYESYSGKTQMVKIR